MNVIEHESLLACLGLPKNLSITELSSTPEGLVVQIANQPLTVLCPLCQQPSERIHERYVRTVADVPCGGQRVILKLTVRKFVCATATCPRQIFTERLAELLRPYARMTDRFRQVLQELGGEVGGTPSVRLAPPLGMKTTRSTVLRLVKTIALPASEQVRVLGVDDFCWKRGLTYGTVLVDLERGVPIDLLADRQAETLEKWLREHPSVEVISRDRGGEYAAAGRRAAPQAVQIADRFHVLRNLSQALERGWHRYRNQLKHVRLPVRKPGAPSAPRARATRPGRLKSAEQARSRAGERYQAVRALALKKVPHLQIAKQ